MPETNPKGSPTTATTEYLILGCGSIGYNVLSELLKETADIVIIDKDEHKVQDLRDQKYEALVRDIGEPDMLREVPAPRVAFILASDEKGNLAAVRSIKNRYPSAYVIVRAVDSGTVDLLTAVGADEVLYPQEVFAKKAVHHARKLQSSRQARRLYDLLSGWRGTLGIVSHTNPDPDTISSAMALCALGKAASKGNLNCRILYDGKIGHQENRAFVNLLDIRMERITPDILRECDYLAIVDSPAPGVNNALPKESHVNIIIDHHQNGDIAKNSADFVDKRPDMGATASLMTQYLRELDIPVDSIIATALFYGIMADTRCFRRNTTPQDLTLAAFLLPLTESELLEKITSQSVSQETLEVLGNAIKNRRILSGYLFSNVGYVRNRDAIPQAAELLIQLEGVNTSLVYGITDNLIAFSARNKDVRLNIGQAMEEAFEGIGDAGGHSAMAAATIPLTVFSLARNKDELLDLVIDPILRKFMHIVGIEEEATGNEI
ncbi:MAG TPA: potassium transporter TrkA [Methanoculleus sp.]|nr:potassium transporter TrkA [Methanoculleus sp.]